MRLRWTQGTSPKVPSSGPIIVLLYAGKEDPTSLDSCLHANYPHLSSMVVVLRNTACILSSWWRVFGSPRSSTSSSRSQPSTVVFLAVFHGRSPGSGSALTRYFMGMKPILPPAQSLNWRFISWSLPCRASLGLVSLVFSSQTLSSWPRSHETVRFGAVSRACAARVPMLHVPPLPWIVEPREPPGTCGPRSAGRSHPCSGGCWGRSPTPPAPSPLPGRASPTGSRGPPSRQNPHPTASLG